MKPTRTDSPIGGIELIDWVAVAKGDQCGLVTLRLRRTGLVLFDCMVLRPLAGKAVVALPMRQVDGATERGSKRAISR